MVFKRFFGGDDGGDDSGEIDIEDYLNDLSLREGDIIEQEDLIYVKSLELDAQGKGIGTVLKELEKGNVIVLNVRQLLGNKASLHEMVKELRSASIEMDGDLGRVSEEKILIVPSGMRIVANQPQVIGDD